MPYNSLRTEIKKRGIKTKTPTKKQLVELLRKDDKLNAPESKKQPKTTTSTADPISLEKEKQKTLKAETQKIAEQNKSRELDIRQQELDMEKIQYGLMSVAEFKKKWNK
jgi:hypothetical protein